MVTTSLVICTLVDVCARLAVRSEQVSGFASALEGARSVVTEVIAASIVNQTFVDVGARLSVSSQ